MTRPAGNLYGRQDAIDNYACIAEPIGCGTQLTREIVISWPMATIDEYRLSGMCKTCQDKLFGAPEGCTCDTPCCEVDIGVGVVTCGSQHCPEHGKND